MKKSNNIAMFNVDVSAISEDEDVLKAVFRMRFPPHHMCHHQHDRNCILEGILTDHCMSLSHFAAAKTATTTTIPGTQSLLLKRFQIEPSKEVSIDITNLVKLWKDSRQHGGCISLLISTKPHTHRLASMILSHLVSYPHTPLLTAHTVDNSSDASQPSLPFDTIDPYTYSQPNIHKRQVKQHSRIARQANNVKCRLVKHYVNFEDLGIANRIIAPKGVHMNYCSGRCFYPLSVNKNHTTVHAELQSLIHIINNSNVPPVCCSPMSYQSIAMLYFTRNRSIVLKRFYKISVQECGCS